VYKTFSFLGLTHAETRFVLCAIIITLVGALVPYLRLFWDENVFSQDLGRFESYSGLKDSLSENGQERGLVGDSIEWKRWQSRADSIKMILADNPSRTTVDSLMVGLDDEPVRAVNLNNANVSELASLPRVGPKLAERIIEYRNQHGNFRNVNELLNVKGIGKKMFDKIRDLVTVK